MFKFEWPLIVPENQNVARLAKATFDIDEYVVDIAKKDGLPAGAKPVDGGVTVHLACHARAQNMHQTFQKLCLNLHVGQRGCFLSFRPSTDC
jgi:glycerol-3-phosphate dehydrogenase subunit C